MTDMGLTDGNACANLWTGEPKCRIAQRVRKGIADTRATLPRAGLPVVIHGRSDGLVPQAFSSAPYVAMASVAGRNDVRYWQVDNAQHFDVFLALPPMAAAYLPLLPYVYSALDRVDAYSGWQGRVADRCGDPHCAAHGQAAGRR